MNVIVAETAGFCMGVALALRKLDKVVQDGGRGVYTLGPIIHNPQVLEQYAAQGVRRAHAPEDIPPGATAVIRAHGVPREVEERLGARKATIVNATCPKVRKAQLLIAEHAGTGKRLLLFGEADHPEVKGLVSYAGENPLVFDSLEQITAANLSLEQRYVLAAQTTQDKVTFLLVQAHLRSRLGHDLPVLDTICDATRERQDEAMAIARKVEAMVVVGGFSSGNTRRLVDVVRAQSTPCHHVETPEQLPVRELRGLSTIGLTAGASTPKMIIDAICDTLRRL